MNKLVKLTSIGFAAIAVMMTSCGDDNDDPQPVNPPASVAGDPSVGNVFSQGLPTKVDGSTFTTNDNGQLIKIEDDYDVVTFEYGKFSRATEFNVVMRLRDKYRPIDGSDIYMQLNEHGFVTYALQVYLGDEYGEDTWRFEYNADGRMTRMQRSEGGEEYVMTYSDGDIVKVVESDDDNTRYEYTVKYTNSSFATPVVNKGNIMMFDDCFEIDMDEMAVAYYAGLLGKSTKHLPMSVSESDWTDEFNWEFNDDELPVKFSIGKYDDYAVTFSWK